MYQTCPLPTPEDRLLFILARVKTDALQVVQGSIGKSNGLFHGQRAPTLLSPPRRAADAPTLGAQQACYARDSFKRAYSEKPARYETDATLWHTRRRCGDWYKHWDRAHCRNERPVQTRASVQNAASGPGKGCAHGQQQDALGRR